MLEVISVDEHKEFQPLQWIKVYGVFSSRCEHLITCQGYQLEKVLGCLKPGWWDDVIRPLAKVGGWGTMRLEKRDR